MSLRLRLVAGLILVAAAGLLTLGGITYAEQRSFLYERVDDQTREAQQVAGRELHEQGYDVPGYGQEGPPGPGGGGGRGGGGGPGGPEGGGGPRPGEALNVEPGTYGERRDASGKRIGYVFVNSFGTTEPARPELPAKLPIGRLITVDAAGDTGLRYRVLAQPTPRQPGTTIVAVPLSEVDRTLDRLLLVEGIVIGAVLLALGGVGWLLVRLGLRPLDRMEHTAGAIAAGDLTRRVSPATSQTEVGRLGLALNRMLERLEVAFAQREESEARLRRFLSDASHELRTPLTSIRGYAEVIRMGAAADEADREKAMARIEEEATRMGVLVEDLLALARLDEVPDARREPVDLAELAADAAHDARAIDPERAIDVRTSEEAIVLGDEHQLRQVLANLLRNALVHTPAGTAIEITVRAGDRDTLELKVRDHGPGLPPGEPSALFERFWRAGSGRVRGRAGAGLGLAIVAAIVARHDGKVTAADAPGGGATFVVSLPRAPRKLAG